MVILFVITFLLPFFVGFALFRVTNFHCMLLFSVAFLILWAFLSFLLRKKCRKSWIVILSIHAPGLILLLAELIRTTLFQPASMSLLLQAYTLPSLSIASFLFSRLFYLMFGAVTFHILCVGALVVMMAVSLIGCLISKIANKTQ